MIPTAAKLMGMGGSIDTKGSFGTHTGICVGRPAFIRVNITPFKILQTGPTNKTTPNKDRGLSQHRKKQQKAGVLSASRLKPTPIWLCAENETLVNGKWALNQRFLVVYFCPNTTFSGHPPPRQKKKNDPLAVYFCPMPFARTPPKEK